MNKKTLSEKEIYIVWAAMQAMVSDIHSPQDLLTEEQWGLANKLLIEIDGIVNDRPAPISRALRQV